MQFSRKTGEHVLWSSCYNALKRDFSISMRVKMPAAGIAFFRKAISIIAIRGKTCTWLAGTCSQPCSQSRHPLESKTN